jgi:rod shape-determining protein MreC
MQVLIALIRQYRVFLLFIFLELVSFWMIVQANYYQNAVFLNSANQYIGSLLQVTSNIGSYFRLGEANKRLAQENIRLHEEINVLRKREKFIKVSPIIDSMVVNQYNYQIAEVVNNSTNKGNNYLTINKGKRHGLKKGMAVISPLGVVGQIKQSNNGFSTVVSLLHSKTSMSAQIKKNGELGTIRWNGKSPKYAQLEDIPTYAKVQIGDTICTSGQNAVFPPRITIGVVRKIRQKPEQTNYELEIELSTSFNSLDYVYVIKNILQMEQDSLRTEEFIEIEE